MNFVSAHTVMVHRAGIRTAGVGIARVDITVINIIWRDILFCIRRNLARFGSGICVAVAAGGACIGCQYATACQGKGCRQEKRSQFVIFIMVLLFLSLRWITFSNSASCSVAKDPRFLNYVRMESRINI